MKMRWFLSVALFGSLFVIVGLAGAVEKKDFSLKPVTNNGIPWKIGYLEGGPYSNYYKYLQATVMGLMDLGWIDEATIPKACAEHTEKLWHWLSTEVKSEYIQFVDDAYYTANWDKNARSTITDKLIKRLNKKNDINLIVAMGSWAGKDLANNQHHIPTVIMSTSDPIGSGIIKSVEDSGYGHIHARVDPYRYERQIRLFHELTGFKKLGIAYEDSVFGRTYAAIDLIEKVATERNFEVVSCFTKSDISDQRLAGQSVMDCFNKLAPTVDAIYVTRQGGVNSETIPKLVEIAGRNRIPTFSQSGSKEVKNGFLMSISSAGGFRPAGRFFAATFAQIFNGAKPGELNQLFEESPNIAVNLKTAEVIGFYLRADLLAAADEIYKDIENPK